MTVRELFLGMPQAFQADKAAGENLVFQFHITGEEAGDWQVIIAEGQCRVAEGVHPQPTVTLTLKDQDWLDLARGKLSGMKAVMTGRLKIKGNLMAAQKLNTLFTLAEAAGSD